MSKPNYIDSRHERFDDYETLITLFEGDAYSEWAVGERDYYKHYHKDNPLSFIYYNFIKLYAEKIAEIVIGKSFNISTGDLERDKILNDWIEENNYADLQEDKVIFGNILGDSPVKWRRENEQVFADYIPPSNWYPIVSKYNINIVEGHAFVFDHIINKKTYYLVEEYRTDSITYKAFDAHWKEVDLNEFFPDLLPGAEGHEFVQENPIKHNLVTVYKNAKKIRSEFSAGDFDRGSLSLVYNIAHTISGIHATNSDTRNPIYNLPNGTIQSVLDKIKSNRKANTNGKIKNNINPFSKAYSDQVSNAIQDTPAEKALLREYLTEMLNNTRALEKSPDGQTIDVVEHNPRMENSFTEIKTLTSMLFQVMSIAPVLIDSEFKVGDVSGVALRNLATATLKKAAKKSKKLIKSIKSEMIILQELMGLEPMPVTVEIIDGLATEPQDDIQWIGVAYKLGLISKPDAIAILRDMPHVEAQKKADELDKLGLPDEKLDSTLSMSANNPE